MLLVQVLLLPRLNPEKAIRVSDLPALFINPQARIGLIAVLLIGLAHFAAYTYVAPFFKQNAGFDGPTIGSLLLLYGVAGVLGNIFAGFAANRSVRHTLMLVAVMIGISTALFPHFATGMTGAAILIALWGFAFGAFPACASIWMFIVAPKDVERGMPLFVAMFQVIIALGSFFGGQIVDQLGTAALLSAYPLIGKASVPNHSTVAGLICSILCCKTGAALSKTSRVPSRLSAKEQAAVPNRLTAKTEKDRCLMFKITRLIIMKVVPPSEIANRLPENTCVGLYGNFHWPKTEYRGRERQKMVLSQFPLRENPPCPIGRPPISNVKSARPNNWPHGWPGCRDRWYSPTAASTFCIAAMLPTWRKPAHSVPP